MSVAVLATAPMKEVDAFVPLVLISPFHVLVWLLTSPKVMFLSPLFLPVSMLNMKPVFVTPELLILLVTLFSKYDGLLSVPGSGAP